MKSPPRLEPRDIQRLLEHSFAAKRRENASAPQNGISSQTQQGIPPQGFQNHIPARGRKHGTHDAPVCREERNFKTISPQGDGNYCQTGHTPEIIIISKPYPRKGTETQSTVVEQIIINMISKPYPRKGTETRHSPPTLGRCSSDFKTISPQGDGNLVRHD